jgi:hypothetical protein
MFLDISVLSDSWLSRPSPGEKDDVYGQQIVNESKEHVIVPRAPLRHDLNHCTKDAPEDIQPAAYTRRKEQGRTAHKTGNCHERSQA